MHLGSREMCQSTSFPCDRDIIRSRAHSRNERAQIVSESQKTDKTPFVDEPSAGAPGLQTEKEVEGEGRECSEDKLLPKAQLPGGTAEAVGSQQNRDAKEESKGEISLEEPPPPQESIQKPRTEDKPADINAGAARSWLRPPERISRYPHGNPSQPRLPRTQSVPLHPVSLQSAACSSAIKTLREARNASMQSTRMITVQPCELSPRASREDCLPPLVKPSPRTPPPTALQPIRLSPTIL